MSQVALGVVGVGSLGFHHARILRDLEGVRMVGVFDTDSERLASVSNDLGVPVAKSAEELFSVSDGVVVAVPTCDHEAVAVAALTGGVHALVEKPMAESLGAADRILAAAEAGGARIVIGHVERFNSAVLAAIPFLDSPLFIESHRLAPFQPRSTDVAVVLDLMIHDVDLVQGLVGEPISNIAATGVPVLTPSVDIANARISFEGGAVANLTASRVSLERMRKLRIFQRSGYLSLDLALGEGEFLRLKQDLPVFGAADWEGLAPAGLAEIIERVPLVGDGVEPLRRELENFRDVVRGEAGPVVGGEDGRSALAVSLSIEERIKSHVADTRST
jgi:predicted dehydrogenase